MTIYVADEEAANALVDSVEAVDLEQVLGEVLANYLNLDSSDVAVYHVSI